jgi:AraC family transcriptional activator FtrA
MEWMRRNLREPHSLGSLAEQAALSQRTLQRQFLEATGLSPIDWLIRERVAFARELLETTDRPLQWIAEGRLWFAGIVPSALPGPGRCEPYRVPQPVGADRLVGC